MALLPSSTFACMMEMISEGQTLAKTQKQHYDKAKAHLDKSVAAQDELNDLLGHMVNKGVLVEVSVCSWLP